MMIKNAEKFEDITKYGTQERIIPIKHTTVPAIPPYMQLYIAFVFMNNSPYTADIRTLSSNYHVGHRKK